MTDSYMDRPIGPGNANNGNVLVMPFAFEGLTVRVTDQKGEPWFVLADVCRVLEVGNPSQAASRLDDDERGIITNDTPSGPQQMVIVSESGLYSLILTSRKPAARRFKRWVTSEVLPTIRKTGAYGKPEPVIDMRDPAQLVNAALQLIDINQELKAKVEEQRPIVAAYNRIANTDGLWSLTDAAKVLGQQPRAFIRWLFAEQLIYKRPGSSRWVAYQSRIQAGLLDHKVHIVVQPDGAERAYDQCMLTAKGIAKLARDLKVTLPADWFPSGRHLTAAE